MKLTLRLLVFSSIFISTTFGQSLTEKLPMDPSVKVGKLSNGMTYYIKKNQEPQNRAELRLVVNAGSILETDEEQGLAHFLEHMQFNGTENFPKNDLVDFLQKSGLKFGADLNAYTSFDETVYQLPVPTDSLEKFEKYFLVLSDWANKAILDPEEIDKERGVVLEEARLGKGAQSRIRDQLFPVVLKGSKYAERLPIGKENIIQNFKYETLEAFYKKWYRPDLQAVVAVGDFEVEYVENLIKKYFGSIPAVEKAPERKSFAVPMNDEDVSVVITDKEQPYTIVQLYYKYPEKKEITGNDRKRTVMISLTNAMMRMRIQELMQQADPPFQFGASSYGGFIGGLDALTVLAVAKNREIKKALDAVLSENQRVQQFGFTATELERAKIQYKSSVEKQYNEREKTNSAAYVSELVQGYLNDVVMTDIAFDLKFVNEHLASISLAELNELAMSFVKDEDRVAVLLAPEKDKDKLPSEADLLEWINKKDETVKAYVDETLDEPLIQNLPSMGSILQKKALPQLGGTEYTLSNGVKVIVKPTDFKSDEVLFLATSKGGSSLISDVDYDNISFGSSISSVSGLGPFSRTQLSKYLTGKIARVTSFVGSRVEGLSGSAAVKDLETALELIYAQFTAPRYDEDAVQGFMTNQKDFLKSRLETPTPEQVYADTVNKILSQNAFRSQPMTLERMNSVDTKEGLELFKNRFADANDFVFTIVGNVSDTLLEPLIKKYLATLPTLPTEEKYKNLKKKLPKGRIDRTVRFGSEDKATVSLYYIRKFKDKENEEENLRALEEVLNLRLIEKLREEEGGVYSPRVSVSTFEDPKPVARLTIKFGCAPSNVDKLIDIAEAELAKIREEGPQKEDIQKYIAEEGLDIEERMKTNSYWLSGINNAYLEDESFVELLEGKKALERVSAKGIQKAAKKYFSGKNRVKAVLLPIEE